MTPESANVVNMVEKAGLGAIMPIERKPSAPTVALRADVVYMAL